MYTTTEFWCCLVNDIIDCSDVVVVPDAAVSGTPITPSRDVEAKPSIDYG